MARTAACGDAAQLAEAKGAAWTYGTTGTVRRITRVALEQRCCEQMTPEASGRISFIVEAHVFGEADILTALHRDLRDI